MLRIITQGFALFFFIHTFSVFLFVLIEAIFSFVNTERDKLRDVNAILSRPLSSHKRIALSCMQGFWWQFESFIPFTSDVFTRDLFCLANLKKNPSVNRVSVYGDLVPHWQSKGNLIKGEKAEAHDAMRAESQLSDIHTHLMIKENI